MSSWPFFKITNLLKWHTLASWAGHKNMKYRGPQVKATQMPPTDGEVFISPRLKPF